MLRVLLLVLLGVMAESVRPPLEKRGANAGVNFRTQGPNMQTNRLLLHAVDDNSNKDYYGPVADFLRDLKSRGYTSLTPEEIDEAAARRMEFLCYGEQRGPNIGQRLLHGLGHFFPRLKSSLCCSRRAMASWSGLDEGEEGQPLAQSTVYCMSYLMMKAGYCEEAMVVLLMYDTFCRSADWYTLSWMDVSVAGSLVALRFGARDRGLRVKTGSDQGVTVDDLLVRRWLRLLKKSRRSHKKLISCSPDHVRSVWNLIIAKYDLVGIGPLHSLRHSRPSVEAEAGAMALDEIRIRGRWKQPRSVQRYSKGFAIVQRLANVTPWVTNLGTRVVNDPTGLLLHALRSGRGSSSEVAKTVCAALVETAKLAKLPATRDVKCGSRSAAVGA